MKHLKSLFCLVITPVCQVFGYAGGSKANE
jgi:hypothetical protein